MADDPRRAMLHQWRQVESDRERPLPSARPQQPTQPRTPTTVTRRPSPPSLSRDTSGTQRHRDAARGTYNTNTGRPAVLAHSAIRADDDGFDGNGRTNGYTDTNEERKGADPSDHYYSVDSSEVVGPARKGQRPPLQSQQHQQQQQQRHHHQQQQRLQQHQTPRVAPRDTSDSYTIQRERLRRMQARFAELQRATNNNNSNAAAAARPAAPSSFVSTTASTAAYYYELESPMRSVESATGVITATDATAGGGSIENHRAAMAHQQNGNQTDDDATVSPRPSRQRTAPSQVMEEVDANLWRSFTEHHHPSLLMSRDAADMDDDDDDEQDDFFGEYDPGSTAATNGSLDQSRGFHQQQHQHDAVPPPVVQVRLNQRNTTQPPFREELSRSRSSSMDNGDGETLLSPPHSLDADGNPYVSQYMPTSEDLGVHLPLSSDFESIPSISLSPPASPAARHSRPQPQQSSRRAPSSSPRAQQQQQRAGGAFPLWSLGFFAGCVAAGLSGIFMEELLALSSSFFTTTTSWRSYPVVSRMEQREMARRLDLLQLELANFKKATIDIEHQSQSMVYEVRTHLEKMKHERKQHQEMISQEMVELRKYVHLVAEELVESEKQLIRNRLMETIAETMVVDDFLPDMFELEDREEQGKVPAPAQPQPVVIGHGKEIETETVEKEEPLPAYPDKTIETIVMKQVDHAIAHAASYGLAAAPPQLVESYNQSHLSGAADRRHEQASSFVSLEWTMLLAGVAVIAGVVGNRVHKASLRKAKYRDRRSWRFEQQKQHQRESQDEDARSMMSDGSEVETVAFMRGESEDAADTGRSFVEDDYEDEADDDDVEITSECHGEEEDEKNEDTPSLGASVASLSSDGGGDYEFQAAQFSEDVEEIEQLDESPSVTDPDPPTPYPRKRQQQQQQHLEERLADGSPAVVRRSPRIQSRSSLSYMR